MDEKTQQSRNRYNKIAQHYDESFDGKFTLPYNQFLCDQVTLKDNDIVLDVACGSGRLLRMLSSKAKIMAYGIDVSEEMIKAASNNFPDAVFTVCPADDMTLPDNRFNLVTVNCAFHHFARPDVFLKEAYRVLKPNGKLAICDPSPIAPLRWIDNLVIPRMKMGDVKLYSTDVLIDFLRKADFANIDAVRKNGMIVITGKKSRLSPTQKVMGDSLCNF